MSATKSVGGISFFFGFFSLALVLTFLIVFAALFISVGQVSRLPFVAVSFLLGMFLSKLLSNRNRAVYFHELRHAIVSNLVGNKAVKMSVDRKTGSFQYKYSKESAKYNALISLAPYTLPLWTFFGLLAVAFLPLSAPITLGITLGADAEQWWRDFSPHQTDLTQITGGVMVGMTFVIVAELVVLFLVVLIALMGYEFWSNIGNYFLLLVDYFSAHITARPDRNKLS